MRSSILPALILTLFAAAAVLAGPAAAHADYVFSSPPANGILPTAPAMVSVTLSEAVQPGTQTIRVTDVSGVREDVGGARISAIDPKTVTVDLVPIGPGVYTVTWIVEDAVDGHWTSGFFYFMVQNPDGSLPGTFPGESPPSAPVSLAEVFLRFVAFVSLAISLGGTVFAIVAWVPAGRDLEAVGARGYESGFLALLLWARLGAFLFAAAAGAWWVHAVTEAPPEVVPTIITGAFSITLVTRAFLGLGMGVVLSLAIARSSPRRSQEKTDGPTESARDSEAALIPLLVTGILGIVAVLAGSAGSHASASALSASGLLLDGLHQMGVYSWVGGLLAMVRLRTWLRNPQDHPFVRGLYNRFSQLAVYSVALVLGAGVVLSLFLVGTFDALVGTEYGWILLAKVSLFAPMVALGAYNRFRVLPASSSPDGLAPSMSVLTRNVRIEAVIGAVVLALAALLTASTPPVSGPPAGLFVLEATSGGLHFTFEVDPYPTVPGNYTFQLLLTNATTGAGYGGARSANLTFNLTNDPSVPPRTVRMDGPHGNHFFVDIDAMSKVGTWRIDAVMRPMTGSDVRATFYVVLRAR